MYDRKLLRKNRLKIALKSLATHQRRRGRRQRHCAEVRQQAQARRLADRVDIQQARLEALPLAVATSQPAVGAAADERVRQVQRINGAMEKSVEVDQQSVGEHGADLRGVCVCGRSARKAFVGWAGWRVAK
eukprot:356404-Chlamydomonas_euryale.AAC.3